MADVFILEINHEHGNNISAYATRELAKKALVFYCKEWWNIGEMGSLPKTDDEIIDTYFKYAGYDHDYKYDQIENYEIYELTLIEDEDHIESLDNFDKDSDGNYCNFHNFYHCNCGEEWSDWWSCACNDRCPRCNKETEPFESEEW